MFAALAAQSQSGSFFFYGGTINLTLSSATAALYNSTLIANTFLAPASIASRAGDVYLALTMSTVTTLSSTVVQILISNAEYTSLQTQIFATTFTPLTLTYGSNDTQAVLTLYCLL